jgi:electron transfer flavoprotein alpha subunit
MLAEIVCATARPQMATVRPHVFPLPDERQGRTQGETIRVVIEDSAQDQLVTVHEEVPEAGARCTLSRADVIVCGGRGLGDRETFSLCEELAELLGGATAATRPAVEQGWTDRAHQIGLSGMTVAPKLLITCGVAGAAPFVAGMQRAETVVAINQDPEAPIFRTADYGIVGDARVVLPLLIKKLREPRLHK